MTSASVTVMPSDFSGYYAQSRVVDYSIQEGATPRNLDNLQGSTGSATITIAGVDGRGPASSLPNGAFDGAALLSVGGIGQQYYLLDGSSAEGDIVRLDVASIMQALTAVVDLPAFDGTLGAALAYYFSEAGVLLAPTPVSTVDTMQHVTLPPVRGELWPHVKSLLASLNLEMQASLALVQLRPVRSIDADISRLSRLSLDLSSDSAVSRVEVYYYNSEWVANRQVYPDPNEPITARQMLTVGASEEVTTNIPVNMWIGSVNQPTHVTNLPWFNDDSSSAYSVVDKDGELVSLEDWRNGGGSVTYAIGADGQSVDVTVRGMATNEREPYRIAGTSDDREYQYPALYIAATGVAFDKQMISVPTGADAQYTNVDAVTTVDNPVVRTIEQAYSQATRIAQASGGWRQVLSGTSPYVDARSRAGAESSITFEQFNEAESATLFGQGVGEPTTQFGTLQEHYVDPDDLSSFGRMAGSMFRHDDSIYRIETVDATPDGFSWSALPDVTFGDYAEYGRDPDAKFWEFNAAASGVSFKHASVRPLAY